MADYLPPTTGAGDTLDNIPDEDCIDVTVARLDGDDGQNIVARVTNAAVALGPGLAAGFVAAQQIVTGAGMIRGGGLEAAAQGIVIATQGVVAIRCLLSSSLEGSRRSD